MLKKWACRPPPAPQLDVYLDDFTAFIIGRAREVAAAARRAASDIEKLVHTDLTGILAHSKTEVTASSFQIASDIVKELPKGR